MSLHKNEKDVKNQSFMSEKEFITNLAVPGKIKLLESPRFLSKSFNVGRTVWYISLSMRKSSSLPSISLRVLLGEGTLKIRDRLFFLTDCSILTRKTCPIKFSPGFVAVVMRNLKGEWLTSLT